MLQLGCAGDADPDSASSSSQFLLEDLAGSEPLPAALRLLEDDSDLISDIPEVVYTQTLADSGLRVSYTELEQISKAPVAVIEEQWVYMQSCVMQIADPPVILVREGAVTPFTATDDVVRNQVLEAFDVASMPIASASSTANGSIIQISVTDFDGSLGLGNYNLRSILGRYLWFTASLPERNYPHGCARRQLSF